MAGLLTSVGDDKDKAAVYLVDCRRLGITVLPPDVNESAQNFASVGTDIRFGLGAVRNVGANVVASLINTRTEKGKFTDFSDYLNKIDIGPCNKKVTESLVKAGAFDSLGHPRKGLFLVHTDAVDSVLGTKKAEAMGQFDLFGGGDAEAGVAWAALDLAAELPFGNIEALDLTALRGGAAAGRQQLAVVGKRQGHDAVAEAGQPLARCAGLRVPQPHSLVPTSRGDLVATWRVCHAVNRAGMAA